MKSNVKFLIQIIGITLAILFMVLIIIRLSEKTGLIPGIIAGYLVSLFNILGGFFSVKWSFRKSIKIFYLTVIGGMMVRLLFIVLALLGVWYYTSLNRIAFVLSLMSFYLMLQIFEIRYVNNELRHDDKDSLKILPNVDR